MGVVNCRLLRCHSNHFQLATLAIFTFLIFASASASSITHLLGGEQRKVTGGSSSSEPLERVLAQKRLSGPGSSPPTCRSKCGSCFPCKPVHVAVQPGMSTPLEYYPEAWRCKCGNKLFMP